MFTYSGYLRETDDWPVDGVDWTSNACIDNLCNRGLPTGSESSDTLHGQELSTSRRIDMAAIINGHSASPEFPPPKDVEATDGESGTLRTREDLSANDSYDTASEATEGNMCGRGAWCCTPCICRVCTVLLIVMALFAVGLGVGLAPRDESSGQNSVAASTGIDPGADTSSGRVPALDLIPTSSPTGASLSSDPPKVQSPSSPAPSTIPSPTQTSTSFPTQNPTLFPTIYFEWDVNYEDWLVDDDEVPIVGENTNGQEDQGDGVNGEETDGVGGEANGGGNEGTGTNADKEENNNDQGTEMDWGTSGSPYLVGVYYYPWHGESIAINNI